MVDGRSVVVCATEQLYQNLSIRRTVLERTHAELRQRLADPGLSGLWPVHLWYIGLTQGPSTLEVPTPQAHLELTQSFRRLVQQSYQQSH